MSAPGQAPTQASGCRVVPVGEASIAGEWDAFVASRGESTFCHLFGWKAVMEDVLGHRARYFVARGADGELLGVLPLVYVRAAPLGRYLVSMPFINHGGPLGGRAALAALTGRAVSEAAGLGVDLLELRLDHPLEAAGLRVSSRKLTVVMDLPPTADQLWTEGLSAKLRSQIRRPTKEGMETRFGPEEIGAFYEVFARHMRDLGTPVLSFRYFERVREAFDPIMEFGTVYRGDVPVAAGFGFVWKGSFELVRASALREFSRAAPNMLLYWSFMERMIARGIRVFNFGRCSPGSGTHRFKSQWPGRDVPLPWLQWSRRGTSAPPNDERRLLRMAAAAWRRVPVPVANRLGPILARRLP